MRLYPSFYLNKFSINTNPGFSVFKLLFDKSRSKDFKNPIFYILYPKVNRLLSSDPRLLLFIPKYKCLKFINSHNFYPKNLILKLFS